MQHYPQIRKHIPKLESTKYILETSFTLDLHFSTTQINSARIQMLFFYVGFYKKMQSASMPSKIM